HGLNRRSVRAGLHLVAAEGAVLESDKPGRIRRETDICGELALKHLSREKKLVTFFLVTNTIGDGRAAHGSCQLGNEVANLIRMRHQHDFRRSLRQELLQASCERVRRVRGESWGLQGVDLG